MYGWVGGFVCGYVNRGMCEWVDGFICARLNMDIIEWVDGWMDGLQFKK